MPIHIYKAIIVGLSNRRNFPFNLTFNTTIKDNRANGPGVYLISFKGIPIYFGSYRPFNRGNIFNDRWLRHIETITLRGHRVGFGNANADMHQDQFLQATTDNILDDFDFRFYQISGLQNQTEANQVTTAVERYIIHHFDFPINQVHGENVPENIGQVEESILGHIPQNLGLNLVLHLLNLQN